MGKTKNEWLLALVERVETLEDRKQEIATEIGTALKEARVRGFDPTIIRAMIRERRMTASAREEYVALLDIYRAALGMLADTPLGEAARKRLSGATTKPDAASDATLAPPELVSAPPIPPPSPEDLLKARAEGAAAAKAGRPVTANPHPAGDGRRGAWDEGWCAASASDGMDIPPAWRRSKPAKGDGKGTGQ